MAASEKIRKGRASGQLLEEAKKIGQSLSSFGHVISSLSAGKGHIPYRDSLVTRILSDALGGRSFCSVILGCHPTTSHFQETLSTLRMGMRIQKVFLRPKLRKVRSKKPKEKKEGKE